MSKRSKDELGLMDDVWDVMLAFVTLLQKAIRELGGTFENVRRLTTPEGAETVKAIAALIVSGSIKTLGDTYRITVDYSLSLAEMIAAGKYNYKNNDINEKNFPINRPAPETQTDKGPYRTPEQVVDGVIEVILVHLNKVVSTADFLRYCEENSLRPGTLPELLALAVAHPELQRQFPIVALGSVWVNPVGGAYSPYLSSWFDTRELDLFLHDFDWADSCRFLAVGK